MLGGQGCNRVFEGAGKPGGKKHEGAGSQVAQEGQEPGRGRGSRRAWVATEWDKSRGEDGRGPM